MERNSLKIVLKLLLLASAECAHVPRPVPPAEQLVISGESSGARLTVPRLEYGAYPDHILDAAMSVYVVLDNGSDTDLSVTLEDFSLGPPNGLRQTPLQPRQILVQRANVPDAPAAEARTQPVMLAGPVVTTDVTAQPAPPPTATRPGVPVYSVPPRRGTYYSPGYYRPGLPPYGPLGLELYGAPYFWGPNAYFWGWGPYWGSGVYGWDMPYYSPRPRLSIIQSALQTGVLPKGGRAAGFLYFSRMSGAKDGMTLMLHWDVRDAAARTTKGRIDLPLEMDTRN